MRLENSNHGVDGAISYWCL